MNGLWRWLLGSGRSYSCNEITEISKSALNNLKLMSNGRNILNLNKSCDGCGDLIRWAKQHNIPINDDSDTSAKAIENNQSVLVLFIILVCMAVAFLIFYMQRM